MISRRRRSKILRGCALIVASLLLGLGCTTKTNTVTKIVKVDRQMAEGGADPSGGEGQRSTPEQLRAAVNLGLNDLPALLLRMGMHFRSDQAADLERIAPIAFLMPCFPGREGPCVRDVFESAYLMAKKFRASPNFVTGDCPAADVGHSLTDMSIDKDLNLCVSEHLLRYPERELKRQVLSLLAHEVTHGSGFGEEDAKNIQYWVIDNQALAFPSPMLASHLGGRIGKVSLRARVLSRILGYKQRIDPLRACEYILQLHTDFTDMESIYSGQDEEVLIAVPEQPIKILSQRVRNRIDALALPYCLKKEDINADLTKPARAMVKLSSELNELLKALSNYTGGLPQPAREKLEFYGMAHLTALMAVHDIENPSSGGGDVSCTINGGGKLEVKRGTGNGKEHAIDLGESKINLTLRVSHLNPSGGVGLLLNFAGPEEASPRIAIHDEVKIISTDAQEQQINRYSNFGPTLYKVVDAESPSFVTRFQVEGVGEVEFACTSANLSKKAP